MSLMAEVVVEEWLNRHGYFTIRGVKIGSDEMDLLAVRPGAAGIMEYRHIEVQASVRPVSYITRVPKQVQKETGKTANSAARSESELRQSVIEWVDKKYRRDKKVQLIRSLGASNWTCELVVNRVKSEDEVNLIQSHGIKILRLGQIVHELRSNDTIIKAASGSDLLELMHLASPGDRSASSQELTALVSLD